MQFLCLHGMGTNSQIFELQTGILRTPSPPKTSERSVVSNAYTYQTHSLTEKAAIRHALGDHHTYEFIEGSIPCAPAPGTSTLSHADDEFFRYLDDADINASGLAALNQLDEFIRETGPYDALFAFSEGAGLAASLLVRRARLNSSSHAATAGAGVGVGGPGADLPLIKCAVFFSAGVPRDPETGRLMDPAVDGQVIDVPTAHIWGKNDDLYPSFGPVLSSLCKADMKEVYVHDGGHMIPGARDMEAVKNCVSVIRKTTELATIFC